MRSLCEQSMNKDLYEIFVVDNNSTDNTKEVCRQFINKHGRYNLYLINERQQGSSFARNAGAALAKGEILVFMDDDAIADKYFLERIFNFFNDYPDAAAVGGRIIPKYIPEEPKWMSYYVSSLVGNFDYSEKMEIFAEGKYPLESNMAVRKNLFDLIGGFSTFLPGVKGSLRIGGEGKDFFLRLAELGKPFYYKPDVVVEHIVEVKKLTSEYMYRVASGIGRGERVRTLKKNRVAYLKKIFEYSWKLLAAMVLAMGYVLQMKPAKAWPVIQFRIDAFKGLLNY